MKRVYIAHPYNNDDNNRVSVENIIKKLIKENPDISYMSPIHATGFLYTEVSYEKGMEYCFSLLDICDELLLCPGWENSRGCKMEKAYAEEHCIPISYYKHQEHEAKLNFIYYGFVRPIDDKNWYSIKLIFKAKDAKHALNTYLDYLLNKCEEIFHTKNVERLNGYLLTAIPCTPLNPKPYN